MTKHAIAAVSLVVLLAFGGSANTATVGSAYQSEIQWIRYDWANSDVAGLAGTSGELLIVNLPADTVVKQAIVRVTGQAAGPSTVTVSVGPDGAETTYILAASAKAAVGTTYGDAAAELGTALGTGTGAVLASATNVKALFTSTVGNLSTVTASTGTIWLRTEQLPAQ